MDGLGGYFAKRNKSNRRRQILYNITYIYNLKNIPCQWILKKETDTENKLVVTSGEREGRRDNIGVGIKSTNYYLWIKL